MPDGNLIAPYYVLEYPDWVNVVAITGQDEMVLVRQYRHGIGKTVLGLPCGSVEEQDASPQDAVKRELLEETGYTSGHFVEIGKLTPNSATHNNLTYCFLATAATQIAPPSPDATEQLETVLVPLQDVQKLIHEGKICQALHVSAIFLALQWLEQNPRN
jgi:8-oxo-dGTP pyrophosphatase MutT (NUDIX family)